MNYLLTNGIAVTGCSIVNFWSVMVLYLRPPTRATLFND